MKTRNLFGIIVITMSMAQCRVLAQDHCGKWLSPIVDGNSTQRLEHISELHRKGKEAVPLLLEQINNEGTSPVELGGSMSQREPIRSTVYCGVVAAYLIELILGESFLPGKADESNGKWMPPIEPYKDDYKSGCIVHALTGIPIDRKSLQEVQDTYRAWWKKNSVKDLQELRAEWQSGIRPLSGSGYRWR